MCKKLVLLASFVVVVAWAGSASAATWTNGDGDNDWCVSGNWSPAGVPTAGTPVVISNTYPGDIDVTCDAFCSGLSWDVGLAAGRSFTIDPGQSLTITNGFEWDNGTETGTVHIYGKLECKGTDYDHTFRGPDDGTGIVYVYPGADINAPDARFRGADNTGSNFEFYMSGGNLNCQAFFIGDNGNGIFEMTGGTMTCSEYFGIRGRYGADIYLDFDGGAYLKTTSFRAPIETACRAHINLDDAVIDTNDWQAAGFLWVLDINEGALRIVGGGNPGNPTNRADIEGWIDANQITGYNGTVKPIITEDGQDLVVTCAFVHKTVYDPVPTNKGKNFCPDGILSWSTGIYVADHNVYFGTDINDVNEGATPVATHVDANTWDPPGTLELNTTYYWRVDTVNDACAPYVWQGGIWSFTTTDGNAFTVFPEDGETKVPIDSNLIWACCDADSYKIYFSEDYNSVANKTALKASGYTGTEWDPCSAGDMPYGTTYYWAIEKVKGVQTSMGDVWSFETEYEIDDPTLKIWYKLDETQGDFVFDSSGHGNHGNGDGTETWDPNDGRFGGSLWFNDNLRVGGNPLATQDIDSGEVTIALWLKDCFRDGSDNWAFGCGSSSSSAYSMRANIPQGGGTIVEWRAGSNAAESDDVILWDMKAIGLNPATLDGWHHWAFVKDENAGNIRLYFDGERVDSNDTVGTNLSNLAFNPIDLGRVPWHSNDLVGKADDFRFYVRALSDIEVAGLFRGGELELAWKPSPRDGASDVAYDANCTWEAGDKADQHKVYFGTSWDDVNSAVAPDATKSLGDELFDPGELGLGQTYYWRVDEVNGPNTWKGRVWSFTVAEFIDIDTFEQYNTSTKRVYNTWCDQRCQLFEETGSWLTLATRPVYPVNRGTQSVEYWYNTNDFYAVYDYAEAWLPLASVGFTDWTTVDVRLLTLFFYGDPINATTTKEQMYIGVKDTDGLYGEMRYGDHSGEDMNDLKVAEWQRWDVPFVWFTDSNSAAPNDVNFADVETFHIGFGNRRNPVAGGEGWVYFDDIRLSKPICKPEYGPVGDLDGDCFVGVGDIGAMGDQWLRGDVNLNPVTPPPGSDPNLVGHWELDGDATDSSGNGYDGTPQGSYDWVTGKVGSGAVDLSGGWIVVNDDGNTPKLRMKEIVSVMAWVNIEIQGGDRKVVVKGSDNQETFSIEVDSADGPAFVFRDANGDGPYKVAYGSDVPSNEWIHIAGTYDQNEQLLYVNGVVENSDTPNVPELFTDPNDGFGIGGRYGSGADYEGKIDDVRVYDRVVTPGEIGYLVAGPGGMLYLQSAANLFSGESPEVINFRDFAKLFDYWGTEQLWPPTAGP